METPFAQKEASGTPPSDDRIHHPRGADADERNGDQPELCV